MIWSQVDLSLSTKLIIILNLTEDRELLRRPSSTRLDGLPPLGWHPNQNWVSISYAVRSAVAAPSVSILCVLPKIQSQTTVVKRMPKTHIDFSWFTYAWKIKLTDGFWFDIELLSKSATKHQDKLASRICLHAASPCFVFWIVWALLQVGTLYGCEHESLHAP
jgi:hypothetical protein